MRNPIRAAVVVAVVVFGLGLVSCAGPGGGPSPSPSPSLSAGPTEAAAEPSLAPSPTAPEGMPVGYQDDWTAEQLAAAQVVDAYLALETKVAHDPSTAPIDQWAMIADDPEYSRILGWSQAMIGLGRRGSGTIGLEWRRVGQESVGDNGRRQIVVTECHDGSGLSLYDANGQEIEEDPEQAASSDRTEMAFTVQWVDGPSSWLVVLRAEEGSC
jgi:hypothetical protein